MASPRRILVIRRDNIGDLVCTLPLFSALRRHYPEAQLEALVNSYNAPVLEGHSEIDRVHIYQKAKHRESGVSKFSVWWATLRLIRRLRAQRFDLIIIATPNPQASSTKFARWIGARKIIAFDPAHTKTSGHEVERTLALLAPLGIFTETSLPRVYPEPRRQSAIKCPAPPDPSRPSPLIGLHLSSRKPSQRWPVERFAALAEALHAHIGARFLVFWSPGDEMHPQHPGDDQKASHLLRLTAHLPLLLCPTLHLEELIAGLSCCDRIICSDGGAMHLAAALQKPILSFFGDSNAVRWHPWGTHYVLLQPPSHTVSDINVNDAFNGFMRLEETLRAPSP